MIKTFKLTHTVDDVTRKMISGRSRDRITGKQVTLLRNGEILMRLPEPEEESQVWEQEVIRMEPTGRRSKQSETQYYSHMRLVYEIDAPESEEDIKDLKTKDVDLYKKYMTHMGYVKFLTTYALSVDYMGTDGKSLNPCLIQSYRLWEMRDVTGAGEKVFNDEMLYHDLITLLRPISLNDFDLFEDICIGYDMFGEVTKHRETKNKDAVFLSLSNKIRENPQAFSDYYDSKEHKITFKKGMALDIIKTNGNIFTLNDTPMGTSQEEAISWLKMDKNRQSYEYLIDTINSKGPKKVVMDSIESEIAGRFKHPSQVKQNVNFLRKKYKDTPDAERVEKEMQKVIEKKFQETGHEGWTLNIPVVQQ